MRGWRAMLGAAILLATASCGLSVTRDVRRVVITYCDAEQQGKWGVRRMLLDEAALRYPRYFTEFPKAPRMEYGPGSLAGYQIEKIIVDWPLATARIRARFGIPDDIPNLGERAPVPEDGWYTVKVYLHREHDLWKVDELATKRQWINTVIGEGYGEAWVEAVKQTAQ